MPMTTRPLLLAMPNNQTKNKLEGGAAAAR
jgi:hypothetical protein